MDKGKITALQLGMMIFMYLIGTAALIQPHTLIMIAGHDGWISVVIAGIFQIALAFFYLKLGSRYPEKTIVEYSRIIAGKWLGIACGAIYVLYFVFLGGIVTRNIGNFIGSVVLPQTPIDVVMLIILIPVMYGCFLGIEVIGRTSEILFPFSILIFLLASVLLIPNMDFGRITPVLGDGILPVIKAVYPLTGFPCLELVVCLMLFPAVENKVKISRYFYVTNLMALSTGILITMFTVTVLGVELTARSPYAVYDMAREIHIERILERAEVIVGIIWLTTSFVKLIICFYVSVIATVQCLNLRSYKHFIFPFFF